MTVHICDDLARPREACGGDLTAAEQATERAVAVAVQQALTEPSAGDPHALHFIGHTGVRWLYSCRCGELLRDVDRLRAYLGWLDHVDAAVSGCCVLCDRRFPETGSSGWMRPTQVGDVWVHMGCVTDAELDRAEFTEVPS